MRSVFRLLELFTSEREIGWTERRQPTIWKLRMVLAWPSTFRPPRASARPGVALSNQKGRGEDCSGIPSQTSFIFFVLSFEGYGAEDPDAHTPHTQPQQQTHTQKTKTYFLLNLQNKKKPSTLFRQKSLKQTRADRRRYHNPLRVICPLQPCPQIPPIYPPLGQSAAVSKYPHDVDKKYTRFTLVVPRPPNPVF